MQKPTAEEIKEIEAKELNVNKAKNFFHCGNCIEQFLGSSLHKVMTPKEYGLYEVSTYEFAYPNGTRAEIMVVWCKRCGKSVWDSRDFTRLY
jgi:hypothetical protein